MERGISKQLDYASKMGYEYVVILGDMETTTLVEKITRLIDSGKMLEEIPIRL